MARQTQQRKEKNNNITINTFSLGCENGIELMARSEAESETRNTLLTKSIDQTYN